MSGLPLLSLAIWVPIFSGLVVLLTGSDRNSPLARMLALLGAIVGLLVTLPLYGWLKRRGSIVFRTL